MLLPDAATLAPDSRVSSWNVPNLESECHVGTKETPHYSGTLHFSVFPMAALRLFYFLDPAALPIQHLGSNPSGTLCCAQTGAMFLPPGLQQRNDVANLLRFGDGACHAGSVPILPPGSNQITNRQPRSGLSSVALEHVLFEMTGRALLA